LKQTDFLNKEITTSFDLVEIENSTKATLTSDQGKILDQLERSFIPIGEYDYRTEKYRTSIEKFKFIANLASAEDQVGNLILSKNICEVSIGIRLAGYYKIKTLNKVLLEELQNNLSGKRSHITIKSEIVWALGEIGEAISARVILEFANQNAKDKIFRHSNVFRAIVVDAIKKLGAKDCLTHLIQFAKNCNSSHTPIQSPFTEKLLELIYREIT